MFLAINHEIFVLTGLWSYFCPWRCERGLARKNNVRTDDSNTVDRRGGGEVNIRQQKEESYAFNY